MNKDITCTICDKILIGKQKKFCSSFCKNQAFQTYTSQQSRGLKRKKDLIGQLGGCCSACGYKKNTAALTFHHINPEKKDFQLDVRSLSNRKMSRIVDEVNKCILICHNCHAELHNPKHNLE